MYNDDGAASENILNNSLWTTLPNLNKKISKKLVQGKGEEVAMISFCKSSFNSILGIPDSDDLRNPPHRWSHILPQIDRGGLRLLASDSPKPPHVVESPSISPATSVEKSPDPGAWGLHEATAVAGGLGLCTESLGSESCDSGIEIDDGDDSAPEIEKPNTRRPSQRRRAEVRFPPPLPWMMGGGGRRSRFLKAERRDGRFLLTEIQIEPQPEILRAIRSDGRLRLELVESEEEGDEEAIDCSDGEASSPEMVEIAGEERSEQTGERWELPLVRNEGQRCVEAGSGEGGTPLWWNHRLATT
ncbi:uncharacterized protein LOC110022045 [Phalaenopsis equestris]|uniref:uncharacterized protein LOC110022045 n=1 Tax=Phalaenopsis equestris TaxID=78828 RepID=UPI0009E4EDC1|nr:uncharacterized protein LOC110022045 [Phalaenopsis equestris]